VLARARDVSANLIEVNAKRVFGVSLLPKRSKTQSRKGTQAYESGKKLEDRVATWLTKQGYTCKKRILVRGKVAARPYEVDIYATKGMLFKHHLWVESKAHKINRIFVHKLVESARDVKDMYDENSSVQSWAPNMLMLVSDAGFDSDAVKLADKYKIYCVHANKTFEFVGIRKRNNMEEGESSEFR
jgi:Holliday junction resolvase-like predicted endonuclease